MSSVALTLLLVLSGCYSMRKDGPVPPDTTRPNDAASSDARGGGGSGSGAYGTGGSNGGPGGSTGDANDPSTDGPVTPDAPTDTEGTPPTECVANLPCTQGIGPCRQGATTCATPTSAPACADIGADDDKGGCTGTNVCKGGACGPPCAMSVPCTDGIKPCRKGATTCASPTAPSMCADVGADDSRGGCATGTVCGNGMCVTPCKPDVACTQGLGPCRKGVTTCASPGAVSACMDSGADDARGGCSGGAVCRGGQCVTLKDRNAACASGPECASGRCVDSHCCNSGEKYCDGQCRAGSYCCNGTACPIANGSGSCSNGSCQRATCNSGFVPSNNQCVSACGMNDGQCPSGCTFSQDADCKKPNSQPCGGDGECQSGNCGDVGGRCCPQGQDYIDGSCRVPCQAGTKSCASVGTIRECIGGKLVDRECPDSEFCDSSRNCSPVPCMADDCHEVRDHKCEEKQQGTSCGSDGKCQRSSPPSCSSFGCGTPVRVGTACCDNINCFTDACVTISGSRKECRIRNGDACNVGRADECVPGNVCSDVGGGLGACVVQ